MQEFDCGRVVLNDWLTRTALSSTSSARTFVLCDEIRVIAYYSLAIGSMARSDLPSAKMRRNQPEQIGVVILARLAVDRRYQGLAIGTDLLGDALRRTASVYQNVGLRAVIVHPLDDSATRFYERFKFRPVPALTTRTLILPIEEIAASFG